MSNDLAVATVTATVARLLGEATQGVPSAEVTVKRPAAPAANDPPRVNLFLYRVETNAALAGDELPTRDGNGALLQRPRAALNLHYLLSFTGNESALLPQRLLGRTVNALQLRPTLTRAAIEATIASFPGGVLKTSDLAQQVESVKLSPLPLDLEQLSKLWSVFFQAPYALSTAYQGSVVLLEPDVTAGAPKPVARRTLRVAPGRRPAIESAGGEAPSDPLVAGATLVVRGRELRGESTLMRLGRTTVPVADPGDHEIRLDLNEPPLPTDGLRAGAQGVQVIHEVMLGDPPSAHRGPESAAAPVLVRPRVTKTGSAYDLSLANVAPEPGGTRAAELTAALAPTVGADQRVAVALTEVADGDGRSYTFPAEPRAQDGATVEFALAGVAPAEYLVSVFVDGAPSPLERDDDPVSQTAGQFVAPTIDLT